MRSNPQPIHRALLLSSQRSVGVVDPDRPETADALEMQRRMSGLLQPKTVFLSGKATDINRQAGERITKAFCRRGPHSGRQSGVRLFREPLLPKENPSGWSWRLPRSADPKPRHGVNEASRPRKKIPRGKAVRWPFRSLVPCSQHPMCRIAPCWQDVDLNPADALGEPPPASTLRASSIRSDAAPAVQPAHHKTVANT